MVTGQEKNFLASKINLKKLLTMQKKTYKVVRLCRCKYSDTLFKNLIK